MEEFYYAGGLPVVMQRLLAAGLLHGDAPTVSGARAAENIAGAECFNDEVIRPLNKPLVASGGIAVLRGNLAPAGAIIKPSAATPALMQHRGRAVVFEKHRGLQGAYRRSQARHRRQLHHGAQELRPEGLPRHGRSRQHGLPPKVLQQGVTDMLRISDARMSGTAYGTVILHTAPEAAAGGPLALVRDGDEIDVDVPARRLDLLVDAAELEAASPRLDRACGSSERLCQAVFRTRTTGGLRRRPGLSRRLPWECGAARIALSCVSALVRNETDQERFGMQE